MPTPIHVTIPEPCHENWQQMTPNEQGRHCMACQKTVVDFTLMSDQEILDHISRASSAVCGRFNNDQLNKTYVEKKIKPSFTFRYAWNMITAAFLLTAGAATAQSKTPVKRHVVANKKKLIPLKPPLVVGTVAVVVPDRTISGVVREDSTGNPVSFASVRIKGAETGVSANEAGRFELTTAGDRNKVTLVVSAVGYTTREYEVEVYGSKAPEIYLTPEADELKPVEVICYGRTIGKVSVAPPVQKDNAVFSLEGKVGELVVIRKDSVVEKVQRQVKEWLLIKKDVRIYPNPVVPGSSINISMNLKGTGEYKLELMDASGKLVWVQAIQVAQKSQVANMPTQSSWSRGVYWMRLSNATDKKVYQAKVLLQ
ncbi:T9SS type A sorting domain-containing protein [Pseudoflavitalea sp. X16]|uniref:carboxypeptidase-like regulatory domain-containing protein n=1 Tax=Paraflavitalea devenefica TaxID=2716334 RepID=UPI0014229DCA|nr:carboxypeptidase-like regulatory domain-containing protein [Paraflavitalea devenefica]NII28239.1 T9SS type A sorting domain-containing protein [Paraflavitalea devenefica]